LQLCLDICGSDVNSRRGLDVLTQESARQWLMSDFVDALHWVASSLVGRALALVVLPTSAKQGQGSDAHSAASRSGTHAPLVHSGLQQHFFNGRSMIFKAVLPCHEQPDANRSAENIIQYIDQGRISRGQKKLHRFYAKGEYGARGEGGQHHCRVAHLSASQRAAQ
jgi:hypothetical protein